MSKKHNDHIEISYQRYMQMKGTKEHHRSSSSQSTQIKQSRPRQPENDCRICKALCKPEDLHCILNQGLFHKYTASQDFFFTRDINAILAKRRKPAVIKFHDDNFWDDDKEYLKKFFKKKEVKTLMPEIHSFYCQFYDYPRNFHDPFLKIINSNIRKHRRLEYVKVFKNPDSFEQFNKQLNKEEKPENEESDASQLKKEFNVMELLGESFIKENYRDVSNIFIPLGFNRDESLMEIDRNFEKLKLLAERNEKPPTPKLSNALYNNNFALFSRNDSEAAEEMIKQVTKALSNEKKPVPSLNIPKNIHQSENSAPVSMAKKLPATYSSTQREYAVPHGSPLVKKGPPSRQNQENHVYPATDVKTKRELRDMKIPLESIQEVGTRIRMHIRQSSDQRLQKSTSSMSLKIANAGRASATTSAANSYRGEGMKPTHQKVSSQIMNPYGLSLPINEKIALKDLIESPIHLSLAKKLLTEGDLIPNIPNIPKVTPTKNMTNFTNAVTEERTNQTPTKRAYSVKKNQSGGSTPGRYNTIATPTGSKSVRSLHNAQILIPQNGSITQRITSTSEERLIANKFGQQHAQSDPLQHFLIEKSANNNKGRDYRPPSFSKAAMRKTNSIINTNNKLGLSISNKLGDSWAEASKLAGNFAPSSARSHYSSTQKHLSPQNNVNFSLKVALEKQKTPNKTYKSNFEQLVEDNLVFYRELKARNPEDYMLQSPYSGPSSSEKKRVLPSSYKPSTIKNLSPNRLKKNQKFL